MTVIAPFKVIKDSQFHCQRKGRVWLPMCV